MRLHDGLNFIDVLHSYVTHLACLKLRIPYRRRLFHPDLLRLSNCLLTTARRKSANPTAAHGKALFSPAVRAILLPQSTACFQHFESPTQIIVGCRAAFSNLPEIAVPSFSVWACCLTTLPAGKMLPVWIGVRWWHFWKSLSGPEPQRSCPFGNDVECGAPWRSLRV